MNNQRSQDRGRHPHIPINAELLPYLKAAKGTGYVFKQKNGNPLSDDIMKRMGDTVKK